MGQYYDLVNVDKKEVVTPYDIDEFAKLMEWSYIGNRMSNVLTTHMADEWKGDRVFVVGDYAEADSPEEPCYNALKTAIDELGLGPDESLYEYAEKNFLNVSDKNDTDNRGYSYRYIYNHDTEQYIDLTHCPIEWAYYNLSEGQGYAVSINPLSLLLAMGNGRGGGDYHGVRSELVGSWCDTVRDIEITEELIPDLEYEEFRPDFTEQAQAISYTDADTMIEAAKQDALEREAKMKWGA